MTMKLSPPNQLRYETKQRNRYAIILAGGDGTRLKDFTRAITGDERPKQFCPILGGETLLQQTQRRAGQKILKENTRFLLNRKHAPFFQPLLADVGDNQMIIQPENKGTAPAILYGLMKLPADSTVVFFPSDHYVSDDQIFMTRIESAFRAAEDWESKIVLIGIEPDSPESSYGWIEPADTFCRSLTGTVSSVKRFWEKPSVETARQLKANGCLWNSFVMVGKVRAFFNIIKDALPELYRSFESVKPMLETCAEKSAIENLYAQIAETNFSTEVLESCADKLYVLCARQVGWSDLGEPHRVSGTLAKLGMTAAAI